MLLLRCTKVVSEFLLKDLEPILVIKTASSFSRACELPLPLQGFDIVLSHGCTTQGSADLAILPEDLASSSSCGVIRIMCWTSTPIFPALGTLPPYFRKLYHSYKMDPPFHVLEALALLAFEVRSVLSLV